MNVKEKREIDYTNGKKVENRFTELVDTLIDMDYLTSTNSQDRLEGWDLYITQLSTNPNYSKLFGKKIDVKGIKGGEYNWVEIVGYTYNARKLGWLLRGKADYIAFERSPEFGDDFILVEKSKLKDFIFEKIPLLKEFHERAMNVAKGDQDKYEDFFLNLILSHWGEFTQVTDKEECLYEKVFVRTYDHTPDMITRIKNIDLENLHTYKINK